jgi:hypothetical protein
VTDGSLIRIDRRFRGPPDSGNGGYVCGCLARLADETVRVRLHRPPPLDVIMHVLPRAPGVFELRFGADLIAETAPSELDFDLGLDVPASPGYEAALHASQQFAGFRAHPFDGCFVCGTRRGRGDGLRIFAGHIDGAPLVAAPWLPDASLAAADGKVAPEFMWAALDCPGWSAASPDGRLMLLGEFTAHVDRRVHVDEPCVIAGWVIRREGRKCEVGTALFDEDGECCARARALWIEPKSASGSAGPR